ncbi:MAG: hypothetical protein ACTSRZ_14135 [Promethearchaeota archaeon]
MIYTFSIINSTGFPFYFKKLYDIPASVDLHLRFYDYCNKEYVDEYIEGFELFAGLISALSEFSRLLGQRLELLKFKAFKHENQQNPNSSLKIENLYYSIDVPFGSDVIVNCQNERFLNITALEAKMNLIYDKIIRDKIPLGPDKFISKSEEEFIGEILDNFHAKEKIYKVEEQLKNEIENLIKSYNSYGLQAIAIMSFDCCILKSYNINENLLYSLLRFVGKLPELEVYNWEVEIAKMKDKKYNLYLINSGAGVKVENIFMPYYYLLICEGDSYLGEIPQKIYEKLNNIID